MHSRARQMETDQYVCFKRWILMEMWCALACMIGVVSVVTLFMSWLSEQRRMAAIGDNRDIETRQSRRYQECTLFDVVVHSVMGGPQDSADSFQTFTDRFTSFEAVSAAIHRAGLEACRFIVAVDFTASNEWQGRKTFHKQCLHSILLKGHLNPYQQVISSLGSTLKDFDETNAVYAFGFGDALCRDKEVFAFKPNGAPCVGFSEVMVRYSELARKVSLAGPTSFAPVIKKSVKIVKKSGFRYHLLVIISDGQMGDDLETTKALLDASNYPLSVIMVGVGDGPWDRMEEYDDRLPRRKFDNFQFVDYHKATNVGRRKNAQAAFALHALMEIPDQYRAIRDLGYL